MEERGNYAANLAGKADELERLIAKYPNMLIKLSVSIKRLKYGCFRFGNHAECGDSQRNDMQAWLVKGTGY